MFYGLYTPTHQFVITGDDNVPTESSYDAIIQPHNCAHCLQRMPAHLQVQL